MGFIEIAMLVLIAIIVIAKGLLIYRKIFVTSKSNISEQYITTLTQAITDEACNQVFSILAAINAVRKGAV